MMCAQNARLPRQQTQDALVEQVLGNVCVHSSQWVVKKVHALVLKYNDKVENDGLSLRKETAENI